jgi:hypothetical protein
MNNKQEYKPDDGLKLQEVDGELVILDKKGGKIHQLNPVATVVWQTIVEHGSLIPSIALAAVTESFDVAPDKAATDLDTLMQQFIELALINPVNIYANDCAQIRVVPLEGKGRGVLAMAKIQAASVIEVAPILLVPRQELMGTLLREYCFSYKRDRSLSAIGLGYTSLYNHSFDPNAEARIMKDRVVFTAKRDIEEGEEICHNYAWSLKKYYSKGVISEEEFDALKKD